MPRSFEDADIDGAVEDPPLLPLAGAVLGLCLAAGAAVWVLLSAFTALPLPAVSPAPVLVAGLVLFAGSMIVWDPSV